MISLFQRHPCSPIGIDVGSQAVKLLQFNGDRSDVWEVGRWDLALSSPATPEAQDAAVVDAVRQARQGRNFRGREAVFSIAGRDLFVQNVRVPQATGDELAKLVRAEVASRLPFPADDAEIRFLETIDIRQGGSVRREIIVLATPRAVVERTIAIAEQCQLTPVGIEVGPTALLRCYARQYRRDEDQETRVMFVHLGATSTTIVIAKGSEPMFIKYVDVGGRHLDEAVAKHLQLKLSEAASMRRHAGDRRSDQTDPELTKSLQESVRPVLEQLSHELSLCLRYYSVTFRGQPLARVVLSGGEAHPSLCDWLHSRIELPCEVGNPLRMCHKLPSSGRAAQWDVAAGLALREVT